MTTSTTPNRPPDEDAEALALLEQLHRAGSAGHPLLRLERDAFDRGVRARAGWTAEDDGGTVLDALRALERRGRGPDLFLVMACDAELPGAWERLAASGLPGVARALTAQGVAGPEADAMAADLPGHLIQPPRHGRSRTRLGGYRGASALSTFLAVAALALRTSERRARPIASLDALGPPGDDPGIVATAPSVPTRLEGAEEVARLGAALPAAWARLTRQEALALLFKCRDDLPQKTIATLLGVGAPRVSRLVVSAQARLHGALVSVGAAPAATAHSARAELGHVIARFLATSFPDVRPWGAPAPHGPSHREPR